MPVPCMSGQAGRMVAPPGLVSSAAAHGVDAALDRVVAHRAVDQPGEEIVLAPHHALGHAGRAARVEHDRGRRRCGPTVRAPARWRTWRRPRTAWPNRGRAPSRRRPRASRDAGHPVEDALDAVGEGPVEHHGDGVGVLPQVAQLVVAVAVVGVDRDEPDLDRGEGGLQVLGRVVEVDGHLVLLRGAEVEQELRDAVGAAVELAPGDVAFTLRHGDRLGLYVRHRLPDVCVVPVTQFRPLPIASRQTRPRPAEMREARR